MPRRAIVLMPVRAVGAGAPGPPSRVPMFPDCSTRVQVQYRRQPCLFLAVTQSGSPRRGLWHRSAPGNGSFGTRQGIVRYPTKDRWVPRKQPFDTGRTGSYPADWEPRGRVRRAKPQRRGGSRKVEGDAPKSGCDEMVLSNPGLFATSRGAWVPIGPSRSPLFGGGRRSSPCAWSRH